MIARNMRRLNLRQKARTSSLPGPGASSGHVQNNTRASEAQTESENVAAGQITFISGCSLQILLDAAHSERERGGIHNGQNSSKALLVLITFARRVDKFSQALDLYAQISPHIACLVWGSLRILIKVDSILAKLAADFETNLRC